MGHNVNPANGTAPRVQARELAQWLDEGRDVVMFDTRNTYEVDFGTFDNAMVLDIHHFRNFPEVVATLDPSLKHKTIVTFCTGGIRCEKAAIYMRELGLSQTLQLEGGILNYFEKTDARHYRGNCFVFDDRELLDPTLATRPHAKD